MEHSDPKRLVIGMSGASGAALGIELLKALQGFPDWESHLVISDGARAIIECETGFSAQEVAAMATRCHAPEDLGACIASGTFRTRGMVIVPCSMKTLAGVATGYADNLLLRAADVALKERRKLVLVARESPLSTLHLRNMQTASELGALILPPMLAFYHRPSCIEDMTRHTVGKILDVFGLEMPGFRRWGQGGKLAEPRG